MGLRTVEGVATAELAALKLDPSVIGAMAGAGLLETPAGRLVATPAGRRVLDRLTLDLATSGDAG